MYTIGFVLKKDVELKDGTHPIALRITRAGKRKYLRTGFSAKSLTNLPEKESKYIIKRTAIINDILDRYKLDETDWTIDRFLNDYSQRAKKKTTLLQYWTKLIDDLWENQYGTALAYKSSYYSFKKFRGDMEFPDLTPQILQDFWDYHMKIGNSRSTANTYLRQLRALINRAIKEGYARENPFKHFSIPAGQSSPRAISREEIQKIAKIQDPELVFARDIFLFSYYARGMNFIDIARLKWDNIKDGRITYKRSKNPNSKAPIIISMKIHPEIARILASNGRSGGYVFPILYPRHKSLKEQKNRVRLILQRVNADLKKIGKIIGVEKLTTYVARHSYATTLKLADVPIEKISQAIGHRDIKTTEIYLSKFPDKVIDEIDELL